MLGVTKLGFPSGAVAAHGAVTVTDTATKIPPSILKHRKAIAIRNWSNDTTIYIGNSDVTTANGYPINPHEALPLECSQALEWYGICAAGKTADTRFVEIDIN